MPITIREILASDTISGAADKINFNFDQLLLNGGGPPGPPGPPGPIGPIGGRGIRGSVWYEGLGDPNLVPPTLTPEDEDNYLRGDGDVWTYNGNTWVNTGISLIGPVGPAGASGKFSEYQGQPGTYSTAGDTTMFPIPMLLPPAGSSTNTSNLGVRSVIIGGFPGGLVYPPNPMFPNTGDQIIVSSLATMIVQPQVSLFVHQFDSNGGGIKFHGGNVINDDFTNILGELAEIRLLRDDTLYINVPKTATTPASVSEVDGIVVTTTHRGQLYQSGKRIQFQTGNSAVSYPFGDTSDFIVDAARNGSGSNPTIQLNVLGNTGAPTAAFRLGSTGTPGLSTQTGDARLGAGLITINGSISITGTSPLITLNGTQQTNIYAGGTSLPAGVNGRVTIGASSQIVMRTINSASTGAISIGTGNGTTGDISITTGNTATGDIVISTWVGNSGDVSVRAATDVIVEAGVDVDISATNEVGVHSKTSDVHIYTLSGSGGDVLIDTDHTGSQIKLETTDTGSQIKLETTAGTSPIYVRTHGSLSSSNIELRTYGTSDIKLDSGDNVTIVAAADASIFSSGNILVDTTTLTGGSISLLADTGNISMITQSGLVQIRSVNSITSVRGTATGITADVNDISLIATLSNVSIAAGDRVIITASTSPTFVGPILSPAFELDATIDANGHTLKLNGIPNNNALSSGTYVLTGTVNGGNLTLNWQRVGNIVSCTGLVSGATPPNANTYVTIPIGTTASQVFGVWNASDGSESGRVDAQGSSQFAFRTGGGGTGPLTNDYYFSFSYRIAP